MKKICVLLSSHDKKWVSKYISSSSGQEEIVFIAPTFEGQCLGRLLKIKYDPCVELAWSTNKIALRNRARKLAAEWFTIGSVGDIPEVQALNRDFNYPLLLMHHSSLTLLFIEVLESWTYVNRIFEKYQPVEVLCGYHSHPFACDRDRLYSLTGSTGMEFQSIKLICERKSIKLTIKNGTHKRKFWPCVLRILRSIKAKLRSVVKIVSVLFGFWRSRFTEFPAVKFMVNCHGDYYFESVKESILILAAQGYRVLVVLTGGRLSMRQKKEITRQNIVFFDKSREKISFITLANSVLNYLDARRSGSQLKKKLLVNTALQDYFSDEYGCFFLLALAAINRELSGSVPETAAAMAEGEAIINRYNPSVVISQFDVHPFELCDVLPARKRGILTLGMNHGICGKTNVDRHAFSSEFLAVEGEFYADALAEFFPGSVGKIFPIGDARIERMKASRDKRAAKRALGFDPERPVCIFCDNSSWRQTNEWRNTEWVTVSEILKIKVLRPDLQLAYRVHHGADSSCLREHIESKCIEDVFFQVSPYPAFSEIILAADLLITHYSSSIAEALISGVPVIYLCALSEVEPSCFGYEPITVVQDFSQLGAAVDKVLAKNTPSERIREEARPYFNNHLCSTDGSAAERLAAKIVEFAGPKFATTRAGFADWEARIRQSDTAAVSNNS